MRSRKTRRQQRRKAPSVLSSGLPSLALVSRGGRPSGPPPRPGDDHSAALAPLTERARTLARAKLAILAAREALQEVRALKPRLADDAFAAGYNRGEIAVESWVRTAVPRVSSSTLWNWRNLFARRGAAALGGRYGDRRRSGKIERNRALRAAIVAMLGLAPGLKAPAILARLQAQGFGADALPSLRRLQAWVTHWHAAQR